ncbi:hypothetical protein [Aureimonas sp. SA4125]|uniref:hypothetical protein n=1 Tax=Aureimonas sp. SA4125 TaxID=2826993 RepID=UPI001CC39A8C|nr:hypothetical protein [Aureimonas sp. SA4125]
MTTIALEDGWSAQLRGGIEHDGMLTVRASAPVVDTSSGKSIIFDYQIMTTAMRAEQWAPEISSSDWDFPIEFIDGPKLARL